MTPTPMKRLRTSRITTGLATRITAAAAVLAVTAAGCAPKDGADPATAPTNTVTGTAQAVFPASQIDPLVAALPEKTVKPLGTERLAAGLVPPTNKWFSGLVFGDQPQPVFPMPLSFGLTDGGFSFGQPTVTASAKTISGGYKPDVAVTTGAKSAQVSGYDQLSVTVAQLDGSGKAIGHTTIAQGSPFISYVSDAGGRIGTGLTFTRSGDYWVAQAGTAKYGLVVTDGSVQGNAIQLEKGGVATWFDLPADQPDAAGKLAELATHRVSGTGVSYDVGRREVSTTLSYATADRGETAFAVMPHQQKTLDTGKATCDLGTFPSIYGTLKLCEGTAISYTAPVTTPTDTLDVSALSADDKSVLATQVKADIKATKPYPADTYFGGKALYRSAQLLQLAEQLDLPEAAGLRSKLEQQLAQWTDPKGCDTRPAFCFVYDPQAKGVVGMTPSFGSDQFNDHHFHYGYFLSTAAILAQGHPDLVAKYKPVMDLLAADLASSGDNGAFPDRRTFDAYAGHSWASGTSPFADGNNQESSAEAMNAWNGLALWGDVSDDKPLATEARWMLSTEAQAGLDYWTNFDTSDPVYQGFDHKIVSLNWGGKRDYATWFSPEPAAMLGILLIPMSPASTYLAGDPARIEANVQEATGGKFDQKFGDYILMYSALAGPEQAQKALAIGKTLDDQWIDDGDSKAYLLAWLMTRADG
ncbi:endoglucanase Acf2 [Friedmanniella endophytica]|uniref:glucan endo-1,3-beta-D-glucosidase n=1 Tax=Microlunatus kandeliicorticis TaxID=1759536 RepID=A0A7W3IQ80_9ACTN|nr:glycosyl hydrolase [Microlunatus kandeliicorticis]MBA8793210.1 endoglucanase Acf2 [Microlunatus kandeliicorticis]